MASRLYSTTRPLYAQVARRLGQLGRARVGGPTAVALIALYVTGLIVLDARPTQTRVARFLPGRGHDALNRLLRAAPFSTRALRGLLVAWVKRLGGPGDPCLDDVVVEKSWAKRLPRAAWTYSFAQERKVYGLHVVALLWCSADGRWRVPVAFRLWRPERSCAPHAYRTKRQVAEEVVKEVVTAGLRFGSLALDTHDTAGWFTKVLGRLGITWVGTIAPRTAVVHRGRRQQVQQLAPTLKLRWRPELGVRATALRVYAPSLGQVRLVVTRNRHGNVEYLVSNDAAADLTAVVRRKPSRWSVETVFRDTKQFAGLQACQCWTDQGWVRHAALVLLTFAVRQMLRRDRAESVAAVQERWQLELIRRDERPPAPLKACPPHLRATA